MKSILKLLTIVSVVVLVAGSCKKLNRPSLGDYPKDDAVLPAGDLRFYVPFGGDNPQARFNVADEISTNPAIKCPLSLVDGVNGKAMQGSSTAAITYINANDFKSATSFTVAFWVKQSVNSNTEFYFGVKDDRDYWHKSAMFLLVEHGTATETTLKLAVMDQWLEFPDGNKYPRPLLDGNWHHLAFAYDQTTSKMTYYFDGGVVPAPAGATDVKKSGNPRGAVDFSTINNLIVGGWNKQAGLSGVTDDWVKGFSGAMDQFRLYNKPLSAAEVQALFTGKL
ncbi:MAG: LamG domain-containing protein [Chitinophagaceae bacterium]|nr:LamG domain-containing protein [Chitinophagaceae bacterium]